MPADSLRDGEIAAQDARQDLGLADAEPINDIVELVENHAGVPVFLTALPGDIAGIAHRVDGRWYIVADSATPWAGPLRFTLAHEFGHVRMHHAPSVDNEATMSVTGGGADPQEIAANYFAAEFLMPRAMVEDSFYGAGSPTHCLDLAFALAERAGATPWVSIIRLSTCGLIDRHVKDALITEVNAEVRTRSMAPRHDIVERLAGTSQTRKPRIHDARLAQLGDLAPGSPSDIS